MTTSRRRQLRKTAVLALISAIALAAAPATAQVMVQCPPGPGVTCYHLSGGDGYITMADGRPMFMFGFSDLTAIPLAQAVGEGRMAANFPAPTIVADEGDEVYLTLTNVAMVVRPDLFDPHSIHWHGFPQQAPIFDGVPENSIAVNQGSSLTYYYQALDPGTYLWHCHVEATEHMQMGMLGNLYVRPRQNKLPNGTNLNGFIHATGFTYAYNDGDGSTFYDVDYPIQIGSFDSDFHDASEAIQPLPFALMRDNYPMLNGRGYPDTMEPGPLPAPAENGGKVSQRVSSLIAATFGEKVLLRISNLNVTRFYTLAVLGAPVKVVGLNARLLRGPTGRDLSYRTSSVTLGGGESIDLILDTNDLPGPGTYFLYTTHLNYLSNNDEDFGGMMTEIRVN